MALLSKPQRLATSGDIPSYDEIHQKTYIWFGFYPCLWQIRVVEAILKHDKDIISIAATGAGKSLTFWMPLLFNKGGIQVVVTPLNILGDQNINDLRARGVSGIAISAENAMKQNFEVNPYLNLTSTPTK